MPYPTIAVIREGKVPPDSRAPLTPKQVAKLREDGVDVVVQPSPGRVFADDEYAELGVPVVEDISDRELLLGVKEVPVNHLIPGKTYCFFAHVAKEQPYNQPLLRALLDKGIRMIDYEYLTDEEGRRMIAFGYWAGMVGAHNAMWTYAQRTGKFMIPRLKDLFDYEAAKRHYKSISNLPPVRVVLTGTGRVGKGAARVLTDMGLREVSPEEYLAGEGTSVFTQLRVQDYARRPDGAAFKKREYYADGGAFESDFRKFAEVSDVFVNGIFWDGKAPAFFTAEEMRDPAFRIRTIGDITCDIAPAASVPSTLYASTIAEPVFGYDPASGKEVEPYGEGVVDVMSIDNLPSELPRDASRAFGKVFVKRILPEFGEEESGVLARGTITQGGELGNYFRYLKDYASGS